MTARFQKAFRTFTITLLGVSAWATYTNIYADDVDLRVRAVAATGAAAGCATACKFSSVRISRGVLEETITYDVVGAGMYVVTCRRPYIAFGDYACAATKISF